MKPVILLSDKEENEQLPFTIYGVMFSMQLKIININSGKCTTYGVFRGQLGTFEKHFKCIRSYGKAYI